MRVRMDSFTALVVTLGLTLGGCGFSAKLPEPEPPSHIVFSDGYFRVYCIQSTDAAIWIAAYPYGETSDLEILKGGVCPDEDHAPLITKE